MNRILFTIAVFLVNISFGCREVSIEPGQAVNAVIGDESFVRKFGYNPNAETDNELRIKTHLEYVEGILRQKDVSNLSAALKVKRNRMLDLLHAYWVKGKFPKNYDYAQQRKPCFIDRDGTICAVGYLIEQTNGRQIAEQINNGHQYDALLAMNDLLVDGWVAESGLTKEECAMIQPSYGPAPTINSNYISPSYGISSSVIGGMNLSLSTINGIQMANGTTNKLVPVLGLVSGAGQIVLGATNFPKDEIGFNGAVISNGGQRTLSMINIGLGTTSVFLSAWNLISQRRQTEKKTTMNIHSFPTPDNSTGLALRLVRKI